MDRKYERDRLKNLIHYVIWVAGARPNFGATKLYKVAWFSDARMFVLHGQSITGAPYVREKYGPIPQDGMSVRNQLEAEGAVQQWQGPDNEWHFKALSGPPTGFLSETEKKAVDYWIGHIDVDHTATSISEQSHDYGWEIAKLGEKLPFHSTLAQRIREPSDEELEWAKTRAKELGLS